MNVEELLVAKDVKYIPKGKDMVVKCLNPEHPDRNPSMRIDKITGIFNCFSCGFAGNIFTYFGEKVSQLELKRELLRKLISEKRAESVGLQMPISAVPYKGDWRGISPKTYEYFNAFQSHEPDFIGRVVIPVKDISGKIVAFNGRHMTGGIPKYYITPNNAKMPLFPTDATPLSGAVVLVEGIFDMLNLYDKGLTNAICCFGTRNINKDKLSLLKLKGVDRVDIFFDGDEAGQKAAKTVKEMAEEVGLFTKNIYKEGKDPGELSQGEISWLKNNLYS